MCVSDGVKYSAPDIRLRHRSRSRLRLEGFCCVGRKAQRFSSPEATPSRLNRFRTEIPQPSDKSFSAGRLGGLFHQRGHASPARKRSLQGDDCFVFCAPSGVGKSTLAASFLNQGFSFLDDNIALVDFQDGIAIIASGSPELRLMGRRNACPGLRAPGGGPHQAGYGQSFDYRPGKLPQAKRPGSGRYSS